MSSNMSYELKDIILTTTYKHDTDQSIVGIKELLESGDLRFISRCNGKTALHQPDKLGAVQDEVLNVYLSELAQEVDVLKTPVDMFLSKIKDVTHVSEQKMALAMREALESSNPADFYQPFEKLAGMFQRGKKEEIHKAVQSLNEFIGHTGASPKELFGWSIAQKCVNNTVCREANLDLSSSTYVLNDKVERVKAVKSYVDSVLDRDGNTNMVAAANPLEYAILETYRKYPNRERMYVRVNEFLEHRGEKVFTRENGARDMLCQYMDEHGMYLGMYVARNIDKCYDLQKSVEKLHGITNVSMNAEKVKEVASQYVMVTGLNAKYEQGKIYGGVVGDVSLATSIGNVRGNQEDAVLLVEHPNNKDFKMMVVADGMGGMDGGEYASNAVVNGLYHWFTNIDAREYERTDDRLASQCSTELQNISNEIYKTSSARNMKSGSTVALAIVGKDRTIIENVGDSRAYLVNQNGMALATVDDSPIREEYRNNRDAMRFDNRSNKITQYMGDGRGINVHKNIVPNASYDTLLLFSDGVTDLVSESRIMALTRNSKGKLKDIANEISQRVNRASEFVREAISNPARAPEELRRRPDFGQKFKEGMNAGKDNTSAIVYHKKKNEEYDR
ncbi:MAG: protein phosphatase 2C domain-containing protein [Clostridia bacterium]|nr:protein phosphatase 2C domain-containing protein [Clostridia bacterium]